MSDYPSDEALDTWATRHAGDIGGLLRGVARECCDWARANPAPQEPTPLPPTSADKPGGKFTDARMWEDKDKMPHDRRNPSPEKQDGRRC